MMVCGYFNPRSPHGERLQLLVATLPIADFNPRSPHGERPFAPDSMTCKGKFQPTLPARGATDEADAAQWRAARFQPTLPARGATSGGWADSYIICTISTHAPRTGSDKASRKTKTANTISTHAPRTGSDCWHLQALSNPNNFNPRSPHGERPICVGITFSTRDFNPRSPHGERRLPSRLMVCQHWISTHAPRTGSDQSVMFSTS